MNALHISGFWKITRDQDQTWLVEGKQSWWSRCPKAERGVPSAQKQRIEVRSNGLGPLMEPATAGPLGHSAVCQLINDNILTATVVEGGTSSSPS
jgi:hypothetical protein